MIALTTAAATSAAISWLSGPATVAAQGDFGGGTFTLEASFDGDTWITLTDASGADLELTAAGILSIDLASCQLRGVLTDSTGASMEFTILPRK